jgi:hypothetical protein
MLVALRCRSKVVLSDYDDEALELLYTNVNRNFDKEGTKNISCED